PGAQRTRLLPGDVLLMASDGVMDAAGEAALARLMRGEGEDMPRLARQALAAAEGACREGRRDDMTAVCLRVEER
ncbi:MAG: SpoIIE family protein phosphatase, partial [Clostridia bacterium]|nr:SpoIIE family protein phosphatase [Clostridia bacterium]